MKPGDAVRFTSTGQIGVVAEVKPSVADNIGSRRWWQVTPLYGAQGIADHILRLLEQEAISRRKAGELLAWGEHVRLHADGCPPHCERLSDPPGAPWDTLNWCDDVCPGDHMSYTMKPSDT